MGERFGDYEIEGRLGAGGMAEVYVARRAGPEGFVKRVCLKRVLADAERDRDAVTQFHDEARLCAHLHHPGIAAVHELGQVGGKWFMAMELVDGLDLRSLLASLRARGAALPADVAMYVVRMVAEALAYAHALEIDGRPAGLVHRDVTPSNVLLSVHGEVKLADFGIARSTLRTHRTRSGIVKGKVPYMAPEQALGEPIDRRTDLFALGVVLFELLAGRRPHDGQTDLDTLTNAQRARRPSLRELAPDVPGEVVTLVGKMLAPRPEDRASSADEVAHAISATAGGGRDPRRALAALVDDARRTRAGAPATRVRGLRARARVQVDTPVARSVPTDEGPTEVGPGVTSTDATDDSGSRAAPRPARSRALPFALGVTLAGGGSALVLGLLVTMIGGERIAHAIADARGPEHETIAAHPTSEPSKPPSPAPAPAPAPAPSSSSPAPSPSSSSPAPSPSSPAPAPSPSSSSPAPSHHRRRPPPETEAAAPSFGRIQIVAVPFGDVTLDGRPVGRAPVTITVEAGPHDVVVTSGSTQIERHVSVDPGSTERVVVDML